MVVSCESVDERDTTPPGELIITRTESTYGGAIISYTLPNDDDILYVRADYTNSKGEAVFRTVSKNVSQIEVSGLDGTPNILGVVINFETFKLNVYKS